MILLTSFPISVSCSIDVLIKVQSVCGETLRELLIG